MARRDDYAKRQQRDGCAAGLAAASQLADAMRDKCSELLGVTLSELAGHPMGGEMIKRLGNSIDGLRSVRSTLLAAVDTVHSIDVTVEVPDNTEWHSW